MQAFANSHYDLERDHGAEVLRDPEALAEWFTSRGLIVRQSDASQRDLARALAVRRGLRALLVANNDGPLDQGAVDALNKVAAKMSFGLRLSAESADFVPRAEGVDGALSVILTAAGEAMRIGTWPRFKACREHDCRWAFYDHSRNAGSSWCSMRVCGSRAKQRAYYRRSAHPGGAAPRP